MEPSTGFCTQCPRKCNWDSHYNYRAVRVEIEKYEVEEECHILIT